MLNLPTRSGTPDYPVRAELSVTHGLSVFATEMDKIRTEASTAAADLSSAQMILAALQTTELKDGWSNTLKWIVYAVCRELTLAKGDIAHLRTDIISVFEIYTLLDREDIARDLTLHIQAMFQKLLALDTAFAKEIVSKFQDSQRLAVALGTHDAIWEP
jgi:hypothetical protein